MTRPDLSFLLSRESVARPAQAGASAATDSPLGPLPEWPALEPASSATPGDDNPMTDLVAEMRNYQTELEIQNRVLDYSRAVAESASERFEALFANVPLPLLVLDGHDMVIQANAMAYKAFQPPGQDRMLVSFMPFVREADCDRVRRAFTDARERGRSEATEVVFNLGNATQMQGDLHIACIEIPQRDGPALTQFMCALIDQGPLLNERRTLQERNAQLHASERRLKSVINSSQDAIICVDKKQRITVFNPTATALFQCHITNALGSKLGRFLPDAVQSLALAPLATQVMLGEMTAHTATGKTLQVEVSMSFERMMDGEIVTIFARDLTASQREEAQRNELETQLRESHKMQALGTMAGGIAHDFNNIVGAILGNVELAKADCAHNPQALESLLEIEKAGRRARDLVRQILTFSRNQPPVRRSVQASEVIRDTEKLLRMTLPPAIELLTDAPDDLPLLADVTQVEQALFNLATNAVHAIGNERGYIRMQAKLHQLDQRLCDRLGLAPGPCAVITVEDNGPGMSAEIVQRIFEPFFTTKPVGQGTGLGLAVVHGVMRTHGGAVDVSSQPGQGSCFTLYFPLPVQEALPAQASMSSTAPAPAASAWPAQLPLPAAITITSTPPHPAAPEQEAAVNTTSGAGAHTGTHSGRHSEAGQRQPAVHPVPQPITDAVDVSAAPALSGQWPGMPQPTQAQGHKQAIPPHQQPCASPGRDATLPAGQIAVDTTAPLAPPPSEPDSGLDSGPQYAPSWRPAHLTNQTPTGTASTASAHTPPSEATAATGPEPAFQPGLHASAPAATDQSTPQRHVMYVDDDQALVFLVQRLLRRRGYKVTSFLDPREATAELERDGSAYDLLVTDYNMPGYSGVDLVRAARAIRPDLPVALASGYITTDIETAALAAGALALIHKPNDVGEFCAVVDDLIHRSTHATPAHVPLPPVPPQQP